MFTTPEYWYLWTFAWGLLSAWAVISGFRSAGL